MTTAASGSRQQRAIVFAVLLLLVFVVVVAVLEHRAVDHVALGTRHLTAKVRAGSAELTYLSALALTAAGFGIGLLGGTLGMGGGVLKVAGLLLLFRYDIFFSRAVSVATMFVMAASAVWLRKREPGHKADKLTRPMMGAAAVGVLIGVFAGNSLRGAVLTHIFGIFVLFLGFSALGQLMADPREVDAKIGGQSKPRRTTGIAGVVGVLHGFFCGLLGVSGGVVSMPMQQTLLLVPVHRAIANSLRVTVLCAGIGAMAMTAIGAYRGDFDWKMFGSVVLALGVGAAAGAHVATRLRGRIYSSILRSLAVVLCVMASLAILL